MNRSSYQDDLHVLCLFSLAVAQPLLDLLSKNPQFFVVRGNHPSELYLFVATICFLLPAALILLRRTLHLLHEGAGRVFQAVLLWSLLVVILILVQKEFVSSSAKAIVLSASLLAGVLLYFYYRTASLRLFATYLSPAFVIVPILFLTNTGILKILRSETPLKLGKPLASKTPVVVLVLDELPLGSLLDETMEIDRRWFPNFARVQNQSTWYRNASAVSDMTECAVPAILTGLYPKERRLPDAFDYPENLFSLLAASYHMRVIESDTRFHPEATIVDANSERDFRERARSLFIDLSAVYLQIILPTDYARLFPSLGGSWRDFWQTQPKNKKGVLTRAGRFDAFLRSIHYSDEPVLYFLHVQLPHGPWSYFPSGTEYNFGRWKSPLAKEETMQGWGNDPSVSDRAFQRYMLQLIYTDRLLGQLLDRLQEQRLWDRSVFVVVADHGISFDPADSYRTVKPSNYIDILSVPLFIKMPGQREGRIDERNAETIDILPTLADVLKSETHWKWDGESLLMPSKRSMRRAVSWSIVEGKFLSFPSFSYRNSKIMKLKKELFGEYAGEEAVYRFGPHPELHGMLADKVPHVQQEQLSAEIYNRQWFDNVDLSRKFVPALVTGKVYKSADLSGSMSLAIAINGTIRGSVQTFRLDNKTAGFALLVPESSFRQGKNDVEVFEISAGNLSYLKTGWIP